MDMEIKQLGEFPAKFQNAAISTLAMKDLKKDLGDEEALSMFIRLTYGNLTRTFVEIAMI